MKDTVFIESFEERVKNTIEKYRLIEAGERVAVACSGGKDSTAALYILDKLGYNPDAVIIDLEIGEYSGKNLENLRGFCAGKGIKLHAISIKDAVGHTIPFISAAMSREGFGPCHACGILKRWLLNKMAREMGFDKVATGHNLDDEAQNIFMNFVQGNLGFCAGLGPVSGHAEGGMFVERIKPLYFCPEEETRRYSQIIGFPVVYEPCPLSADTFRTFIKGELDNLEAAMPGAKRNMADNLVAMLPSLRGRYKQSGKMRKCRKCGEPSRSEVCRACELLGRWG